MVDEGSWSMQKEGAEGEIQCLPKTLLLLMTETKMMISSDTQDNDAYFPALLKYHCH